VGGTVCGVDGCVIQCIPGPSRGGGRRGGRKGGEEEGERRCNERGEGEGIRVLAYNNVRQYSDEVISLKKINNTTKCTPPDVVLRPFYS
jgi:hypothetical protein